MFLLVCVILITIPVGVVTKFEEIVPVHIPSRLVLPASTGLSSLLQLSIVKDRIIMNNKELYLILLLQNILPPQCNYLYNNTKFIRIDNYQKGFKKRKF